VGSGRPSLYNRCVRSSCSCCLFLALATGCGDDGSSADAALAEQNCATDDRAPEFAIGLAATGANGYTLAIEAATPFPAARGDNAWTVAITDGAAAPAAGLQIAVDPRMPDHGHGTPIVAVVTETGTAGTYEIDPINLWMPGYWEIGVQLSDSGGSPLDAATFKVCVDP